MTIKETIDKLQYLLDNDFCKNDDLLFIALSGEGGFTEPVLNICAPRVRVKYKEEDFLSSSRKNLQLLAGEYA